MDHTKNPLLRLALNPTLVVSDGCILLSNPAADAFFGGSPVGQQISDYIPANILKESAEEFVISTTLQEQSVTLTVSHDDNFTYFIIHPQQAVSADGLISPAVFQNLRSSLSNMKLSAELILRQFCPEGVEFSPKAASHVSIFQHNYYRLLRTITSMETANALMDGSIVFSPVTTDLNCLCDDLLASIQPLISTLGIALEFSPCEDEDTIAVVDRGLIEQMLLNLLSNSLSHTPPGGSIRLSLSHIGNHFVFSLNDTGSGIAPETLTSLFSHFEQAPALSDMSGSNGFGMFIAKGIAERHGGTVMVESREGHGTSVRVMIADHITHNARMFDCGFASNNHSMENILIQLSSVLSNDCYVPKILDS